MLLVAPIVLAVWCPQHVVELRHPQTINLHINHPAKQVRMNPGHPSVFDQVSCIQIDLSLNQLVSCPIGPDTSCYDSIPSFLWITCCCFLFFDRLEAPFRTRTLFPFRLYKNRESTESFDPSSSCACTSPEHARGSAFCIRKARNLCFIQQ